MNIAIVGGKRSGKDTVANYLVDVFGYKRFAFADDLKYHAHEIFGLFEGKRHKLYQDFGEGTRAIDQMIWIRKTFENIGSKSRVVISDLRTPDEYDEVMRRGYVIIRVHSSEEVRLKRMKELGDEFDDDTFSHVTEQHHDLFMVNYNLYNDGSIQSLHEQIDHVMRVVFI